MFSNPTLRELLMCQIDRFGKSWDSPLLPIALRDGVQPGLRQLAEHRRLLTRLGESQRFAPHERHVVDRVIDASCREVDRT
jgi:hypothetical protein